MDYKATLNLPKTAFAMKADLPTREPETLKLWDTLGLYARIQRARAGAKKFILHDGPPYANGDIHIGHALNKILKDVIVRYATMRGYASPYVPGWDCHGMPIEHQLFKELKLTKQQIPQTEFREKAKAYAARYVDIQREQFKRLGVQGDWDHPYLTMSPEYERAIIRVFMELVRAGRIYRGQKPVSWCPTCETALAEAEVEYEDRTDTSIYVKFLIDEKSVNQIEWPGGKPTSPVYLIIWTTTPWTLPANVAVAVSRSISYQMLSSDDETWIVAETQVDKVRQMAGKPMRTSTHPQDRWDERSLRLLSYQRPFSDNPGRVLGADFVSIHDGTGIVHIAPGHGDEDYRVGIANNLEVLSPVDEKGRFTKEAGQWVGQTVWEANLKIIADLKRRGLLLKEEPLSHSYPHCWRCKQPVIVRATPQWFLRVDEALRAKLLASAQQVRWIPEAGRSRMRGMLQTRPDWCLSRQRYWGTPIPIVHCLTCDQPLVDDASLRQIEQRLAADGTEAWLTTSPQELLPGGCPKGRGHALRKDSDILDVWFDSGVSHEAVLRPRADVDLQWPASLYLEGSDQHRGWFQVSLMTAAALSGRAPYEQVLTHGFVVDGDGRKMSKSLGNVIAPSEVIERYGAEMLRLWVVASDYSEDVRISEPIVAQMAEAYRKLRNTFRYLLGNLSDFSPARDRQPPETMPEFDQWALQRAQRLLDAVTEAYAAYHFHQAFRAIYQFCVLDLSSCYLDALKDRLYTGAASGCARRCAQTALYDILLALVRMLAPMLPMTTEEVWQLLRNAGAVEEVSVHLAGWPAPLAARVDEALMQRWETFLAVRAVVMKALEEQRSAQVIGSPLEAQVSLAASDPQLARLCEQHRDALVELFVVSEVGILCAGGAGGGTAVPGLAQVRVTRADGAKCQRCWKYRPTVGQSSRHPQLCDRCVTVVQQGEQGR